MSALRPQNNTILQLTLTPLNSMSALRITQLCNSHQLLNSMSTLHSQNNIPCFTNLVFLYPLLLICKLPLLAYKESTNSHSSFFLFSTVKRRRDVSNLFHYFLDHKGLDLSSNKCPGYDSKQSDGGAPVMLELWACRVLLRCHHSQVHSDLERYQVLPLYG